MKIDDDGNSRQYFSFFLSDRMSLIEKLVALVYNNLSDETDVVPFSWYDGS
jgi:hypothetical protein